MYRTYKKTDWYALMADGTVKNLGKCSDFEQADRIAPDAIWILDPETAKDWREALK